ncbi:uncharacterized protein LOC144865280 [Branchiostoma floridae x Branchiostoma japonicum]
MGKEGVGERNDNDQRLVDVCMENGLVIGGTIFKHKNIHKLSWVSPDGRTSNQIDHICINRKWRKSLRDVKAIRGADASSDHHLMLCKLQLKLRKASKGKNDPLFDSGKLKDLAVKEQFTVELKNRFQVLEDIPVDDINARCEGIHKVFTDTSKAVLGYRKRERKEWLSDTTWNLVQERKAAKQHMLNGSERQRAAAAKTYQAKNKEVKRSARRDKRVYMDSLATEAQQAAEKGDTRTVYKITKQLSGDLKNRAAAVKDKNGKVLMEGKDQLDRWAEHFRETLNRPPPESEATIEDMGFNIEMKRGPITLQEIVNAIKETKANRAPGEDRVTADMLKVDPVATARGLITLFNQVWYEETVPEAWKRGIIVKLPKKGDLSCCVRHDGQHSEWFHVKTGVRQGCVISPTLFLVVIDWVMRRATAGHPRGIVWGLTSRLEDCDFADDIALLSHAQRDIQEKTNNVDQQASSVGLKTHQDKTKILKVKSKSTVKTTIRGQDLEEVQDFKYLGSYISSDSNIEKEVSTRIGMAAQAFNKLRNIWKASTLKQKTKLRIYRSNVRSVLLYAAETWRTNKKIEQRIRGFESRCLRRILKIRWEQRVSNKEVAERTGIPNIVEEIKRRRWKWLGHVLRMHKNRHPYVALKWTPQGKRSRGRPLGTWRRTVEGEMKAARKTWHEVRWMAQDRKDWKKFVSALCSIKGSEED